jgi:hypothetical protein
MLLCHCSIIVSQASPRQPSLVHLKRKYACREKLACHDKSRGQRRYIAPAALAAAFVSSQHLLLRVRWVRGISLFKGARHHRIRRAAVRPTAGSRQGDRGGLSGGPTAGVKGNLDVARCIRDVLCHFGFRPEFSPPRPPRSQRIATSLHFRGASRPKCSGVLFPVVPGQCFEDWQFHCMLCGRTATFGFSLGSGTAIFRTAQAG